MPVTSIGIAKTGTPCYVLISNPEKRIIACKYGDFNYSTPATNSVIVAATYTGLQAQAAGAGITGLPAQREGQP